MRTALACTCLRFCNDSAMDVVAKRNDLSEEEYDLELLIRGHFHRNADDQSGEHSTGWVSYRILQELEKPNVIQNAVQRFLDVNFSMAEDYFNCTMPQTFTQPQ